MDVESTSASSLLQVLAVPRIGFLNSVAVLSVSTGSAVLSSGYSDTALISAISFEDSSKDLRASTGPSRWQGSLLHVHSQCVCVKNGVIGQWAPVIM